MVASLREIRNRLKLIERLPHSLALSLAKRMTGFGSAIDAWPVCDTPICEYTASTWRALPNLAGTPETFFWSLVSSPAQKFFSSG